MVKYIIFDLDGTLVNSIYDLADSVNFVLRQNGYTEHPLDSFYYFIGNGTLKLIERALPQDKRTKEEIERVHSQFSDYYSKNYLNKTVAYDGINELLDELDRLKIKYAVASNKTDIFTCQIIDKLFDNNFDAVVGKKDGNPTKPDPKIIYDILEGKNLSSSEILFVGDSNIDIQTGHNAGIKAVGCLWGFRDEMELKEAGADFIISHPSELLRIINNLYDGKGENL